MSWDYGTLATEIYEIDKPVGYPSAVVGYYTGLLAGVSGRILEPAAGTGRILIPLLEAGHEVDGLDTSPQMLAVCRRHGRDRGLDPVLHEADMTTFVRPGAYQAVIIPAGSFELLDGTPAAQQALACFRESLAPGGRLLLDIDPPQLIAGPEPVRHWRRDHYLWALQVMDAWYDSAANQTTRLLRYEKWQDGALVATELQWFRLQHWSLREFEGLLAGAGFTDILVTADYQADRRPGPDSDIWTFHATRP